MQAPLKRPSKGPFVLEGRGSRVPRAEARAKPHVQKTPIQAEASQRRERLCSTRLRGATEPTTHAPTNQPRRGQINRSGLGDRMRDRLIAMAKRAMQRSDGHNPSSAKRQV